VLSARSAFTISRMVTDILNQLDSTSPELPGSEMDRLLLRTDLCTKMYLVYPLASFKVVIVDNKGVKQVGHYCNNPIPVGVGVRLAGQIILNHRTDKIGTLF
jgi:hypothetical protein